MSPRRRAWNQCMESAFLVFALVAILEVILPALERKAMDWNQIVFACAFGLLIILAHTVAAYVRPPEREERIEERLTALEERWKPPGPVQPTTQFAQARRWAAPQDPTWAPTVADLPAMRSMPLQQQTQKPPRSYL